MEERIYIAIDLKSFYASVECVDRGLDPLTTNLVVADPTRTEKTICLAVSPSLKAYGIPGRARLFEVQQKVKEINQKRQAEYSSGRLYGESFDDVILKNTPQLKLAFITAPPRMAHYIKHSTEIYKIYLKYVAPEDIHVYSIDEVFMDVTDYLNTYKMTARELTETILNDVLETTGITATAGIGTNLYLCKIAMDIVAKHVEPDMHGARIAELNEHTYREQLWNHRPITDFWRVGRGYAKKLEQIGIYTMGDIARCSIGKDTDYYNEDLLYRIFGINAELLIDHAWGYEPCSMAQIKAYKPEHNSIGTGQVLQCPYNFEKARLVTKEMTDLLVLDLVDQGLVTNQMILTVGYDIGNLDPKSAVTTYKGAVKTDHYGRTVPKHAHGTINLDEYTSSTRQIMNAVANLYDKIVNPKLMIRRINITANFVIEASEAEALKSQSYEQMDLFTDYEEKTLKTKALEEEQAKEKKLQQAMLDIKKKYGKNAVLRGMNLEEGATAITRNNQIGGHKA